MYVSAQARSSDVTCVYGAPRTSRSLRRARSNAASSVCAVAPMTMRWGLSFLEFIAAKLSTREPQTRGRRWSRASSECHRLFDRMMTSLTHRLRAYDRRDVHPPPNTETHHARAHHPRLERHHRQRRLQSGWPHRRTAENASCGRRWCPKFRGGRRKQAGEWLRDQERRRGCHQREFGRYRGILFDRQTCTWWWLQDWPGR